LLVFSSIITQPHLPYSEYAIRIQRSISPKNLLRLEVPITRLVGQRAYLENLLKLEVPITRLAGHGAYLENFLRLEVPITRLVGQGTYLENLSEIGGT
jgi:hypothetical protein